MDKIYEKVEQWIKENHNNMDHLLHKTCEMMKKV